MSFPTGIESSEADIIAKLPAAVQHAKDATSPHELDYHRQPGLWPHGTTVLRVALIAILLLIVAGWALSAFNR